MGKKTSKDSVWGVPAIAGVVLIVLAIGGLWIFKDHAKQQQPMIPAAKTIIISSAVADTAALNSKPGTVLKIDTTAIRLSKRISPVKKRKISPNSSVKYASGADSSVNMLYPTLDKDEHVIAKAEKKEEGSLDEMAVMTYNTQKRAKTKPQTDSMAKAPVLNETIKTNTATRNKQEAHPQTGFSSFEKYLKDEAISSDNMTGTVSLSFIVNNEGVLSDFKVLKSVSDAADQKAIALVKNGPGWLGNSNGEAKTITVKVKFHKAG